MLHIVYAMKITSELGVTIVAAILVVTVVAAMKFSTMSAWAQTMMPGNQTSSGKTMAGNTTGGTMKGNTTSAVPTPQGPPGP